MSEYFNKIKEKVKNPKLLIILGIIGIALILFSSLFEGEEKSANIPSALTGEEISTEEYRKTLEENVGQIVKSISGDKRATVVITLESGIRYDYADSFDTSSSNSTAETSQNESSSSSKTYITFRTDDGGEKPLIITKIMPEVRGVAIVCEGGDNAEISEKIKSAVTAALNITSKRVCIAGGYINEKR